jgi:putative ABC transport system substrate-binding protein
MGKRADGRRRLLRAGLAAAGYSLLSGCGLPPAPWQPKPGMPRIGYLGIGTRMPNSLLLDAFRRGLRDLGYVEGETIEIEYRFLDDDLQRAPTFAAEIVALNPDVIVTAGFDATIAARDATSTIPIVGAILGSDPVAEGLVPSLARPGGNLTGLIASPPTIGTKQLQILHEVIPSMSRVAALWNSTNPVKVRQVEALRDAAAPLGLTLHSVEVRRQADFDAAFQAIQAARPDALWVGQEPLMAANAARVAAFAVEQRLPAIYETRLYTDLGGLMNYGVQSVERYYRAATYVDRILKGAKPAEIPVEQPTAFDFVINLSAARAIGLTIPPSVLNQATEIIH